MEQGKTLKLMPRGSARGRTAIPVPGSLSLVPGTGRWRQW
jgi:hypothetical protein